MTSADPGQYWSLVTVPSSTNDGRPSHTSMVMSANSSVAGSMCHDHGAFTPGSSRTTVPSGIDATSSPASSCRAWSASSGVASSTLYVSPTTWIVATGFPVVGGGAAL